MRPQNETAPEDFTSVFIKGGWRAVERVFGPNNDTLMRWYNQCGGEELKAQRDAYMAANRKASVASNPKPRIPA